jgi:hypothetical protein
MPEIIITAAGAPLLAGDQHEVTLRERVNEADFESERFGTNLLERIEWAVADATELERRGPITGRLMPARPTVDETPEPPNVDESPEPEQGKTDRSPDPVGVV